MFVDLNKTAEIILSNDYNAIDSEMEDLRDAFVYIKNIENLGETIEFFINQILNCTNEEILFSMLCALEGASFQELSNINFDLFAKNIANIGISDRCLMSCIIILEGTYNKKYIPYIEEYKDHYNINVRQLVIEALIELQDSNF